MRVIAGKAKSLRLKTVEGLDTRPTTDRIKETLFNMISSDICDCSFLDLFAGSGGIGIEALSRGAARAVFVENSRKAAECIRENLTFTKLTGGQVLQTDVLSALERLKGREAFDLVFMDPPYGKEWEKQVLCHPAFQQILKKEALIIVEASLETSMSYARDMGFEVIREKTYKTNKHVFLQLSSPL